MLDYIGIFSSDNRGVAGKNCDVCEANYWAYTSFGCRECSCNPQVRTTDSVDFEFEPSKTYLLIASHRECGIILQ